MKMLLLLFTFIFRVCYSQILCDPLNKLIPIYLEHPPQPNIIDTELESKLNNVINPSTFDKYQADYLYITFYVNCKGEDFNYKLTILKNGITKLDTNSDFQEILLSDISSFVSWTPGTFTYFEKGKKLERLVDFQGTYTIRVDGTKLHILNESEKQKHFKRK